MVRARRLARARRSSGALAIAYPTSIWSDLIEVEFSPMGRSRNVPRGWFIAPVMLTLLMLIPLAL
jgi:hypothetical protein